MSSIFCDLDDFCKRFEPWGKNLSGAGVGQEAEINSIRRFISKLAKFTMYPRRPEGDLCDRESAPHSLVPGAPPSRMSFIRGRRRRVETTGHFCQAETIASILTQ